MLFRSRHVLRRLLEWWLGAGLELRLWLTWLARAVWRPPWLSASSLNSCSRLLLSWLRKDALSNMASVPPPCLAGGGGASMYSDIRPDPAASGLFWGGEGGDGL